MTPLPDPFVSIEADDASAAHEADATFAALSARPVRHSEPHAGSHASTFARLVAFDIDDRALVTSPLVPGERLVARSTVPLRQSQLGSEVVLAFPDGDVRRPVILGVVHDGLPSAPPKTLSVQVDDERVVLQAEREIVLRCGEASITLTRAGKVIISGNYVVSRSTGYNKIKGAAVDIN